MSSDDPEETYQIISQRAQDARRDLLSRIASELSGPLSSYAQSLPSETFDAKRHIASWLNAETQRLGLRLQCGKTGLPATLGAELSENGSRFNLFVRTDKHIKVKTFSGKSLPSITLMIDPFEFSPRVRPKTHERIKGRGESGQLPG